jgi:reverse gyrase
MTANRVANDAVMRIKQLNFMIDQMSELYENDERIQYKLKNCKELLEVENVYMAAQTLQNMLLDKELNKKHHDAHVTIIKNSRKLAYILIMEQAGYTILGKTSDPS